MNEHNSTGNHGFIYKPIEAEHFVFGDQKLGDQPIIQDGQWDAWLPIAEDQNIGIEPMACTTFALLNCVETMLRQKYGASENLCKKFLAYASGTSHYGNDPHAVAETLRTKGDIEEIDYPYTSADNTWEKFYAVPPQAFYIKALEFIAQYAFGHSWVSPATQGPMMSALNYSPLSAGVYAWTFDSQTGYAIRPVGAQSEHDVMIYGYVQNQYWKCFDSYSNEVKKLAWDFGFDGVKRYTLNRQTVNTPQGQSAWNAFVALMETIIEGMKAKLGLGDYSAERLCGATRSPQWSQVVREFAKYVPKVDCFDGSTLFIQLHHSQDPFHSNPARELDPTQLRWVGRRRHLEEGHNGNFQSLNFSFDQRIEDYQNRKFWKGSAWVINDKPRIKYKLTDAELQEWNKTFGTEWVYPNQVL